MGWVYFAVGASQVNLLCLSTRTSPETLRWANRGGPRTTSGGPLRAVNRGKANRKAYVFLASMLSPRCPHPDEISVPGKGSKGPKVQEVLRQSCGGRKR